METVAAVSMVARVSSVNRVCPRVLFVGAFPPAGSAIFGGMVTSCRAPLASTLPTRVTLDLIVRNEIIHRTGVSRFSPLTKRYAVLKDLHGNTRFLLLPTDPISGIESPALLQPGAPNYWQAINGAADHIAVGPDNVVWLIQTNGDNL